MVYDMSYDTNFIFYYIFGWVTFWKTYFYIGHEIEENAFCINNCFISEIDRLVPTIR